LLSPRPAIASFDGPVGLPSREPFFITGIRFSPVAELLTFLSPRIVRMKLLLARFRFSPGKARLATSLVCLIVVPFLSISSDARAERVRITTWNLKGFPSNAAEPDAPERDEQRISDVGKVLNDLNPEIVLLQDVRDKESCERLAKQFKPAIYQVLVCSSFRDGADGTVATKQLAILSRRPALAAGAEEWKSDVRIQVPGGFVFAVVPFGGEQISFYCVQLKNNVIRGNYERENQLNILKRELSAERLLRHAGSMPFSLTNRIDSTIIAGNFNTTVDQTRFVSEKTLRLLEAAGFANGYANVPVQDRVTSPGRGRYADVTFDYIYARNAAFVAKPEISFTELSDHLPVTAELEINTQLPLSAVVSVIDTPEKSGPRKGAMAIETTNVANPNPILGLASPQGSFPQGIPRQYSPWWLPVLIILLAIAALSYLLSFFRRAQAAIGVPGKTGKKIEGTGPVSRSAQAKRSALASRKESPSGPSPAASDAHRPFPWETDSAEDREQLGKTSAVVRSGLIPHLARMMKDRLMVGLLSQRTHMLDAQRTATVQVTELEKRLVQIQAQLHDRYVAYERRIADLEKTLAAKEAENRQLMSDRILKAQKSLAAEKQSAEL
jgi:endonuclease/exonuclease/phosphatase family metal-dependent hydrolase